MTSNYLTHYLRDPFNTPLNLTLTTENANCRVLKKASASLSARRPRGRPPAVGIDSSFFNMTPPSAEAVTPTKEEPTPIIGGSVETPVAVEAKPDGTPTEAVTVPPEITEQPVSNGIEAPIPTATRPVTPEVEEKPIITDNVGNPIPEDRLADETPIQSPIPEEHAEESADKTEPAAEAERFVLAARPDINPNPHSRAHPPPDPVHPQPQLRGGLDPVTRRRTARAWPRTTRPNTTLSLHIFINIYTST
ncbi:unnamed protein product [Chrysodeixis includens]|uniref:Uncharacterized protein n=1 Tax=Chrysodeixis includens TaxID=689277 RepID=A0A9N8L056_CHRIL|nr:unnamed protein product [Chrysodeixis includens]